MPRSGSSRAHLFKWHEPVGISAGNVNPQFKIEELALLSLFLKMRSFISSPVDFWIDRANIGFVNGLIPFDQDFIRFP
jgi:hypothetical protein